MQITSHGDFFSVGVCVGCVCVCVCGGGGGGAEIDKKNTSKSLHLNSFTQHGEHSDQTLISAYFAVSRLRSNKNSFFMWQDWIYITFKAPSKMCSRRQSIFLLFQRK